MNTDDPGDDADEYDHDLEKAIALSRLGSPKEPPLASQLTASVHIVEENKRLKAHCEAVASSGEAFFDSLTNASFEEATEAFEKALAAYRKDFPKPE